MSYTTFIDVDTPHNFDDFVERFLKVCKALTDSSNRACSITPIEEISPLADPKACWAGLSHDLARAFPRRVSVTFATEEEARILSDSAQNGKLARMLDNMRLEAGTTPPSMKIELNPIDYYS